MRPCLQPHVPPQAADWAKQNQVQKISKARNMFLVMVRRRHYGQWAPPFSNVLLFLQNPVTQIKTLPPQKSQRCADGKPFLRREDITGWVLAIEPLWTHQIMKVCRLLLHGLLLGTLTNKNRWQVHHGPQIRTRAHHHRGLLRRMVLVERSCEYNLDEFYTVVFWNRATFSHHPNFNGTFHEINHPVIGYSMTMDPCDQAVSLLSSTPSGHSKILLRR